MKNKTEITVKKESENATKGHTLRLYHDDKYAVGKSLGVKIWSFFYGQHLAPRSGHFYGF